MTRLKIHRCRNASCRFESGPGHSVAAGGERYSIAKALRGVFGTRIDPRAIETIAPNDYRASREISDALGREAQPGCLFVPLGLTRPSPDEKVAVGSAGGFLVETSIAPADQFLAALRAASVTAGMGVQVLDGLTGNLAVPKITGTITAHWLASESTPAIEDAITFGQAAAAPEK